MERRRWSLAKSLSLVARHSPRRADGGQAREALRWEAGEGPVSLNFGLIVSRNKKFKLAEREEGRRLWWQLCRTSLRQLRQAGWLKVRPQKQGEIPHVRSE